MSLLHSCSVFYVQFKLFMLYITDSGHVGAIVGGVFGAVIFIALVIVIIIFLIRYSRFF